MAYHIFLKNVGTNFFVSSAGLNTVGDLQEAIFHHPLCYKGLGIRIHDKYGLLLDEHRLLRDVHLDRRNIRAFLISDIAFMSTLRHDIRDKLDDLLVHTGMIPRYQGASFIMVQPDRLPWLHVHMKGYLDATKCP